ncbi:hypothetical protein ACWDE0_30550 [Streptomyces sp. 900105755]
MTPDHLRALTPLVSDKDPVETKLHTAVCAGKVTLAQAQQAIVTDWTSALTTLGLSWRPLPGATSIVRSAGRVCDREGVRARGFPP